MNRAPAYQEYAADYLANEAIQLMTLEEEGAYNRLKRYCWREGSIPADLDMLSRLCKGGSTTLLTVVLKCFQPHPDDPTRLVLAELEEQAAKHAEWKKKSSEGGKRSAEARFAKGGSTTLQPPFNHPSKGGATLHTSSSSSNCILQTEDVKTTTLALTSVEVPAPFISLTLNDGTSFPISEEQIHAWSDLYPAVDVRQQVRNYRGWSDASPKQRKTRSGILRSVDSWLRNAQDKGTNTGRANHGTNRNQDRTNGNVESARGAFDLLTGGAGAYR